MSAVSSEAASTKFKKATCWKGLPGMYFVFHNSKKADRVKDFPPKESLYVITCGVRVVTEEPIGNVVLLI